MFLWFWLGGVLTMAVLSVIADSLLPESVGEVPYPVRVLVVLLWPVSLTVALAMALRSAK